MSVATLNDTTVAGLLSPTFANVTTTGDLSGNTATIFDTVTVSDSVTLDGVDNKFTFEGNARTGTWVPNANALTLDGCSLECVASAATAPQTAPANALLYMIDNGTNPAECRLAFTQSNPNFSAGVTQALSVQATAASSRANSVVVSRTSVISAPISNPTGSVNLARTQVAAADTIACPTITASCQFHTWLAGLTGTVGATAVLPATVSAVTPGTGFTLNGTAGAIYGYQVLYA